MIEGGEAPADVDQPCTGWIVSVLPQLEEQPLYDQFQQGGAFEGTYTATGGGCLTPEAKQGSRFIEERHLGSRPHEDAAFDFAVPIG